MVLDSLVFLFGCAGTTFLVTSAEAGAPVRCLVSQFRFGMYRDGQETPLERMLQCSFCTGFWVSLAASIAWALPSVLTSPIVAMLPKTWFFALAGAMASYLFDRLALGAEASMQAVAMMPAPDNDDDPIVSE
jgi:hypothetical protein